MTVPVLVNKNYFKQSAGSSLCDKPQCRRIGAMFFTVVNEIKTTTVIEALLNLLFLDSVF